MRVYIGPYYRTLSAKQIAKGLQDHGHPFVLNEEEQVSLAEALWAEGCGSKEKNQKLLMRANKYLLLDGKNKNLTKEDIEILAQWAQEKTQRIKKIKINSYDTWSMDHTLAAIILPMLQQLKATKHGSPGNMPAFQQTSNQAQLTFDFYQDGDEDANAEGHKQWSVILDHMIWAFEQIVNDYPEEENFWITPPILDLEEYPEDLGKAVIPVRWEQRGELDVNAHEEYHEKIKEGTRLFGEYYSSLWD